MVAHELHPPDLYMGRSRPAARRASRPAGQPKVESVAPLVAADRRSVSAQLLEYSRELDECSRELGKVAYGGHSRKYLIEQERRHLQNIKESSGSEVTEVQTVTKRKRERKRKEEEKEKESKRKRKGPTPKRPTPPGGGGGGEGSDDSETCEDSSDREDSSNAHPSCLYGKMIVTALSARPTPCSAQALKAVISAAYPLLDSAEVDHSVSTALEKMVASGMLSQTKRSYKLSCQPKSSATKSNRKDTSDAHPSVSPKKVATKQWRKARSITAAQSRDAMATLIVKYSA